MVFSGGYLYVWIEFMKEGRNDRQKNIQTDKDKIMKQLQNVLVLRKWGNIIRFG